MEVGAAEFLLQEVLVPESVAAEYNVHAVDGDFYLAGGNLFFDRVKAVVVSHFGSFPFGVTILYNNVSQLATTFLKKFPGEGVTPGTP